MREWVPLRDEYLQELLRLEGGGDCSLFKCSKCSCRLTIPGASPFRCDDCFNGVVTCSGCCLKAHEQLPLHRIKKWNGNFFESSSLREIGLWVQLGHPPGETCISPVPSLPGFTVVHTNGIHHVAVNFCGCPTTSAVTKRQQLMRKQWFPASQELPKTCCTFRVLEVFHIMCLQSKMSAYDFYHALAKLTDISGVGDLKDRYKIFLRLSRQWIHLNLLKRGGRGHDATGVSGTSPGELATLCPACPQPGLNVPETWLSVPAEQRFLCTQIVTIDACFRLKRRNVSSRTKDPGLGTGWAYFVEDEPYREYLLNCTDQQEMSTCTGLAALDHANTKFSGGLECTGVGAVQCRHEMQLPTGVGDLQKGERYANIDYIFASAMRRYRAGPKVISYDIACQWSRNLAQRFRNLPDHLFFEVTIDGIRYAIPKFHILAHLIKCQLVYSLNLMRGVGRTDGENIERGWSKIEGAAGNTKEMGPGSRHDALDDHWGFANFITYIGFGKTLRRKLITAIGERSEQRDSFDDFTSRQLPDDVAQWTSMIDEWDKNPSAPNPYEAASTGLTEAAARLHVTTAESQRIAANKITTRNVTASVFLIEGLAIEEQQAQLRIDVKQKVMTDSQGLSIVDRKTALTKRIARFRQIQPQHMIYPADDDTETSIEDVELGLPSSIPNERRGGCCSAELISMEDKLREGQCYEALDKLRHHLHLRTGLINYRSRNVRHQAPSTRARGFVDRNEARVDFFVQKYRRARQARISLIGPGSWERELKVLRTQDVRTMAAKEGEDVAIGNSLGEGRRDVSWLWKAPGADDDTIGMNDALRVEWCKARARLDRWTEEVDILREEMRRVEAYLQYRAKWWSSLALTCVHLTSTDAVVYSGAVAYAHKQAGLQAALCTHFCRLWRKLRDPANDELIVATLRKRGKRANFYLGMELERQKFDVEQNGSNSGDDDNSGHAQDPDDIDIDI
ncbi:hypothetical protein BD410DRAFT_721379 [Rickenella mellea]|uniref:CxC2-like cysteine cluster KDZ transposase-associated domain-containing protein n=1 Tax=Rickenella mellea TaxID=50990 RepID=A0A4Y7Q8G9_9AGAM|nr:hypothetical protein BD410DRAFT_721379 [Rickenella mellea]